jgi:hypothetical protein
MLVVANNYPVMQTKAFRKEWEVVRAYYIEYGGNPQDNGLTPATTTKT